MKKSPLSAPGGSYGRDNKNNYDWNSRSPGYGHQHRNHHLNEDDIKTKQGNLLTRQNQLSPQKKIGDDFIPLGNSSPVNHIQRFNNSPVNNWRGHGNPRRNHRHTPPSPANHSGFNNSYRQNFHHTTPKSNFNESNNSPKFYQRQHFGQRRPYQRGAHRNVDISAYLNIKSILEDPWADLMRNLEKRNSLSGNKTESKDLESGDGGDSSGGDIIPADLKVESKSCDIVSVSVESQITTDNKRSETSTISTTTITEAS